MVVDMNYWTKVLKKILIFLFTLILLFLGFKITVFYTPFLIAFVISLILEPAIKLLMKKFKITRKISAIIIIGLTLVIILGLLSLGIATIVTEGYSFLENIGSYVSNINNILQKLITSDTFKRIPDNITAMIKEMASNGIGAVSKRVNDFLKQFLEWISQIPTIGIYLMVTFLSTYLICSDKVYIQDQMEHHLPKKWVKKFYKHLKEIVSSLGSYLKAELTLVAISFVICLIGLFILKVAKFNIGYPLLYAVAIGFVDALPIFGSRSSNDTLGNNICL